MNLQNKRLSKKAIAVLLLAQAQLCVGQEGISVRFHGPLTQLHTDPPLFGEIDAFYFDGITPATAVAEVQACDPDPKHALLTFTNEPAKVASAYADFGYRYGGSMPLMQKDLSSRDDLSSTFLVQCVSDQSTMNRLNLRGLTMPPAHLHIAQLRYYFVEDQGLPICWGRAFYAPSDLIYVSAVGTVPAYRRQGLATALMQTIHRDALTVGRTASILCASAEAYGLYSKLGYRTLTNLLELLPQ